MSLYWLYLSSVCDCLQGVPLRKFLLTLFVLVIKNLKILPVIGPLSWFRTEKKTPASNVLITLVFFGSIQVWTQQMSQGPGCHEHPLRVVALWAHIEVGECSKIEALHFSIDPRFLIKSRRWVMDCLWRLAVFLRCTSESEKFAYLFP